MRKTVRSVLIVGLVIGVMMIAAAAPARAAGTLIHISNVTVNDVDCSIGYVDVSFDLGISVPDGETAHIWYSFDAPGATSPFSFESGINNFHGGPPLKGPLGFTEPWNAFGAVGGPLAPNTNITIRYYNLGSHANSTVTVNCTTGAYSVTDGAGSVDEEAYTGIVLLPEEVTAPYSGVPNAAGVLPCGVFDVNGWGTKFIGLADFPACTPPVEVLCFNDAGQWTADNVSNVVIRGDYEVDFDSSQDGTCAFFPTS